MKKIPMLIGLLAALCIASCDSHHKQKPEQRTFTVTHPIRQDTTFTKEYVCQIHAYRNIEVRALERGYLQDIYIDEGQHVKKGQQMFHIMPNIYQAELQRAQAEGESARIEYENTKLLSDSSIVAPNELAMAKAEYDRAKADISLAQTHLGFTNIKAPFEGVIDHLHAREGSLLDEGELLTTLSDNSKMWVYYNVPEAEYLDYRMIKHEDKQEVKLLLANNKQFDQTGTVETIEGEFNNETGNIAFRATFPNPDDILRHGETGNILMSIPLKNALLIPQKATFEVLDKKYVFVIDKDHVIHQREIKIGAEIPQLFEVQSGLTEEDEILLEGIRLVKANDTIKYNTIAPKEVFANLELYAE